MAKQNLDLTLSSDEWLIQRRHYFREEDSFYESLFALTNGKMGIRATSDFVDGGGQPGVFLVNLYGPGLAVRSEIVNALHLGYWKLDIDNAPLHLNNSEIIEFNQTLDLFNAALSAAYTLKDCQHRITKVKIYTFLPASEIDLIVTVFEIEPVNHSSKIDVYSGIDWRFGNGYMGGTDTDLRLYHLQPTEIRYKNEKLSVCALNQGTSQYISAAVRHITAGDEETRRSFKSSRQIVEKITFAGKRGKATSLIRLSTFGLNSNPGESISLCESAADKFEKIGIKSLLKKHRAIWQNRWEDSKIHTDAPLNDAQALNYGVFQLLQAPEREAGSTNISARSLTSEYHSGHFFFNTELYLTPYYSMKEPEIARSFIMFRVKTLAPACQHASETGFEGARYPEETDRDGFSASPYEIYEPFTGKTIKEWSGIEVMHLSADVLHSLFYYLKATGDEDFFFQDDVLKMIIEIARYCSSLLKYDEQVAGRGVLGVMCFDEFHYHVDHHFATNYLSKWSLEWVLQKIECALENLSDEAAYTLRKKLNDLKCGEEVRKLWKKTSGEVFLPKQNESGVYPQFEGYFSLPVQFASKSKSHRLPEITGEVEQQMNNLLPFETQLIKQADIVMLMSMFPDNFSYDEIKSNFEFYEPRTIHASSLSVTPHSHLAAGIDKIESAYQHLMTAFRYNLDFQPRKNYLNGIHLAGYAGAWNALLNGFLGFKVQDSKEISFDPKLPIAWKTLSFRFKWQRHHFEIKLTNERFLISVLSKLTDNISVSVGKVRKNLSTKKNTIDFLF